MMSEKIKTKLGLEMPTDPRWADIAEKQISDILTDHAWCEQKAASSGIALISRFSDFPDVVEAVTPIVAEEWGHFRKVVKELKKRGFELGPQRVDEYVNQLNIYKRKGGSRLDQLVEHLLVFALIEARSCERFRLLSLHISDTYLREFYHEFMVSEASHYKLFLHLAQKFKSTDWIQKRWAEYLTFEAEMIQTLEVRGDRMH